MSQRHEPMTAWACINAILEYAGEPPVLFAEFHGQVGESRIIDPVETARAIIARRKGAPR